MSQYLQRTLGRQYHISRLHPAFPVLEHDSFASESWNFIRQDLSRAKELELLGTFRKELQFVYPIISYDDIEHHYDSLWRDAFDTTSEASYRMPSPLVDILLALAMQYRSTFLLRDGSRNVLRTINSRVVDACVAGQWLYKRSHQLVLKEQHSPTLRSLQSSMLSTIYLLNAGSMKLASTLLAISVRMAQILGMNETLSSFEDSSEQAGQRRRIWRSLIVLDGCLAASMELPPIISEPSLAYSEASIFREKSLTSLTNGSNPDDSWAMCHVYYTKLVVATQSVQTLFRSKQMELLEGANDNDVDSKPLILESVASLVAQKIKVVREWADGVPEIFTIQRRNNGKPFSVLDGTTLSLDSQGPLWQLHQKLALEISYHQLNLLIMRPFVRFRYPMDSTSTMQADLHSIAGLRHAISLVNIVNQAFRECDALTGWLFVFHCQWDATLYLLGYTVANPSCPLSAEAHKSINTAINTFTLMGEYLTAAKRALDIIQDILNCGLELVHQIDGTLTHWDKMFPGSGSSSMQGLSSPLSLKLRGGRNPTDTDDFATPSSFAASSPSNLLWDSTLPSPLTSLEGSGRAHEALQWNQQSVTSFPSDGKRKRRDELINIEMDPTLGSSPHFEDWQSFCHGLRSA